MCLGLFGLVALATPAHAFQEPNTMPGGDDYCTACHFDSNDYLNFITDCTACHGDAQVNMSEGFEYGNPQGPHGGYMTTTSKCQTCHSVHNAPATGVTLLPAATVIDTCESCHDGTGGWGVYGVIKARYPSATPAGHRCEVTTQIPGGDGASGGSATGDFSGIGNALTCTDCHAPHGADTVDAFAGDRVRLRQPHTGVISDRLLRRTPTGGAASVQKYGSDWCLACHKGRDNEGTGYHSHPVDSSTSVPAPVDGIFTYDRVAILAGNDPTALTILQGLGGVDLASYDAHGSWSDPDFNDQPRSGNRGFLMPYPRTAQQAGHAPICQQCHEDSRSVGALSADGTQGDAIRGLIEDADGVKWNSGTGTWELNANDNPLFQNFPHETTNDNMLVETNDDLCLNCHPATALP
jgi:hypothetical protein